MTVKKQKIQVKKMCLAFLVLLGIIFCSCAQKKLTSPPPANALYKNADVDIEKRIEDLIGRMSLEEKIGQMTQIEKGSLKSGDVKKYMLGSVLSGGGGSPRFNNASSWADMVDGYQNEALETRLAIPMIYGTDSVHGHNNLKDATIFPHNIALGATGDPMLVEKIGTATALETSATGIPWNFAPCIAVAHDPRWGRTYESYSQDSHIVSLLGAAYTRGYVDANVGIAAKPVVTAKHYLGDGGTEWGSPVTNNYKLDQGNTIGDTEYLRTVLLPPYIEALNAGARTVMASFSSWNGQKMHSQKELITDILKDELGFSGFVVSDWAGIDQVNQDYYIAVVDSINAGVDMNMVPYDAQRFIDTLTKAVKAKDVSMNRINDAVRRILRVKFEIGLFERPYANRNLASSIRSSEHLALAREAVAKSIVVLKNDSVLGRALLPIDGSQKTIYVAGSGANNIGLQCGGWTIDWQGKKGAITAGTTILQALQDRFIDTEITYNRNGDFNSISSDALCIVVASENPYAEGVGDSISMKLLPSEEDLIRDVCQKFKQVVLVIQSGRPVILDEYIHDISAILAVWLPGTEATGIVDIISGDVSPIGKLSFDWISNKSSLPLGRATSPNSHIQWPIGHGLSW